MKVLITRSEPGASELAAGLTAAGISSVVSPLLEIAECQPWQISEFVDGQWLDMEIPDARPQCTITLSVHAAQLLCGSEFFQQRPWLKRVPSIAIGETTANVLRAAGFQPQLPDQASSEGIVSMTGFNAYSPGSWIWIFAGVGGRHLIAEDLSVRLGLRVCKMAVYERVNVQPEGWDAGTITHVIVSSEQTLRHFADLLQKQAQEERKQGLKVILPSQRLTDVATQLGFANPINAGAADTQTLVDVICRMEQQSDDR